MSDKKKSSSRVLMIGLVVCLVLVVALAAATVLFFTEKGNLQNQVNSLESDKSNLQTEKSNLEIQVAFLQAEIAQQQEWLNGLESEVASLRIEGAGKDTEISSLNSQIATLNTQITQLTTQLNDVKSAHVVKIGVGATQHRESEPYSILIYGQVCNLGYDVAYNAKIHVIAYYIDGTLAIDTYHNIDYVPGIDYFELKDITHSITYDGQMIDMSRITITPEWTNTP